MLSIATIAGEEGLETSPGEGGGKGEYEEQEGRRKVETLFRELGTDAAVSLRNL